MEIVSFLLGASLLGNFVLHWLWKRGEWKVQQLEMALWHSAESQHVASEDELYGE